MVKTVRLFWILLPIDRVAVLKTRIRALAVNVATVVTAVPLSYGVRGLS
jgi:hypothetical protein